MVKVQTPEEKLENRLKEIENVRPITNDRELVSALKRITDEEINSKKPDTLLIDEAVKFTLALEGYNVNAVESEGNAAMERFCDKLRTGVFNSKKKKILSRPLKLALIAVAATIMFTVGTFGALKTLDIDTMDLRSFLSLEKDTVYEDDNHTVVISDNMFVYYDSIDEMMDAEGLDSILIPDGEIDKIMAYTAVYTDELKSRTIMLKIDGLWLYISLDHVVMREDISLQKIGNFDVDFFEYDDKILAKWICHEKEYSMVSHSEDELIKIIKNIKEYIK